MSSFVLTHCICHRFRMMWIFMHDSDECIQVKSIGYAANDFFTARHIISYVWLHRKASQFFHDYRVRKHESLPDAVKKSATNRLLNVCRQIEEQPSIATMLSHRALLFLTNLLFFAVPVQNQPSKQVKLCSRSSVRFYSGRIEKCVFVGNWVMINLVSSHRSMLNRFLGWYFIHQCTPYLPWTDTILVGWYCSLNSESNRWWMRQYCQYSFDKRRRLLEEAGCYWITDQTNFPTGDSASAHYSTGESFCESIEELDEY